MHRLSVFCAGMMAGLLFFAALLRGFVVGALAQGASVGFLFAGLIGLLIWIIGDIVKKD